MNSHWSIGEVLALLQADFPEVTISKIRFLESQGLISPERTPSGYRRFLQDDFDRLRWILLQQRDNYLPLKVIRERLEAGEVPDADQLESELSKSRSGAAGPAAALIGQPAPALTNADHDPDASRVDFEQVAELYEPDTPQATADGIAPSPIDADDLHLASDTDALWRALAGTIGQALDDDAEAGESTAGDTSGSAHEAARSGSTLTLDELADAAGCEVGLIHELEHFGLLRGRAHGSATFFDAEAVTVTVLARRFLDHGLEPRHLRAFRLSAEREVGLLSQLVDPSLRRRNQAARQEAEADLKSLVADARSFHIALVQQVLRDEYPDIGA